VNLGTLKTHIANRTGNDAISSILTELVNQVSYDIAMRYPFRWRYSLPVTVNTIANQNYINPSAYFPNWSEPLEAYELQTPRKLLWIDSWDQGLYDPDSMLATPTNKRVPTHYNMDFDNNRLWFYPVPDRAYSVKFRYLKGPSEVSNASSTLFIPSRYHYVLADGVESRVWQLDEDLSSAKAANERYEAGIARMIDQEQQLPDNQPIMQSQGRIIDFSDPFLEI
jgi:hypothetical protein